MSDCLFRRRLSLASSGIQIEPQSLPSSGTAPPPYQQQVAVSDGQQQQEQQQSLKINISKLMTRLAGRCRSILDHWSSVKFHVWPACTLPAVVCAVSVAVCMWMVAQNGNSCMTLLHARLEVDAAVSSLVSAVRRERDATPLIWRCLNATATSVNSSK
jgi:hypothetical protein